MIKFFRKFRQKFIAEKKLSNYILYAIGEIVLVVIGILIAVQLNNWNEQRKNENKEKAILNELYNEFNSNLEQYIEVRERHVQSINACDIVLRNINTMDQPLSQDSLKKYGGVVFFGHTFNASNGVVESLISSGNFQIIRNDTLRRYLISWKEVLADYLDEEIEIGIFWRSTVEPYMIKHGDFISQGGLKNVKLLEDQEFRNMVARRRYYVDNVLREEEMENSLREIVRLSASE